jgi:hypothetical protein
MTRGDEIVRGESLAALFARGDLDEVLARHLRRPARTDEDRAAVVGAYAWSGRLDEARAQHEVFAAHAGDAAYGEVARCYLVIGLCHAGKLGAARRLWRAGKDEPLPASSPLWFHRRYARAFIAYFAGRMERCRLSARRALRVAVTSGNAFGQLLANDLLAHAMFHLGRAREGQRLLRSATHLSAELNLAVNYLNVMVASHVFAVTTDPADAAANAALVRLLRHGELRYFARRHGHAALAISACLRGDLAAAREQMELAAAASVGEDARGAVRLAAAQACVAAISGERDEAERMFVRALDVAFRRRHIDLFAETAFLRRLVLGVALAPADVPPVAARSDIARLAWARGDDGAADAAQHGDALLARARALAGAPPLRWIDAGLAGLAAVALPPGKVIGVAGDAVVIRSDTAVSHMRATSDVTARLLACLAHGPQSKARLVRELWGLRTYHPRLHDGTLYTAVSRLRRAWGAQGAWLEKTLDGYQLQAGVTVVELAPATGTTAVPGVAATSAEPLLPERLVAVAARPGGVTCAEAAQACGVSASTALRALRALVAAGRMERVGSGSGTKYAPGRDVPGA